MIISKKKTVTFIFLTSAVFSFFSMTGCQKEFNTNNGFTANISINEEKGLETEYFFNEIENRVDPKILRYDGLSYPSDKLADYAYSFMIEDTKGNVGDEVKDVYDLFNDTLKTTEYQGKRIEVFITTRHFQTGVINSVALFKNYDDSKVYDQICDISVYGIDDMTDDYDSDFRYEVNDSSFWDAFSQTATINYSSYVEYQSAIELDQSNIDELKQYLMNDYNGIIEFGHMTAVEDGVHTPSIEWHMTISSEGLKSSNEYTSASELIDSVRRSTNEYYSSNHDDEFLNLRITLSCYDENGKSLGYISNWDTNSKEFLDGFSHIRYVDATTEELINCTDVKIMDLFGRTQEEVEQILDNTKGIEVVYVRYSDMKNDLSAKYPQIEFR